MTDARTPAAPASPAGCARLVPAVAARARIGRHLGVAAACLVAVTVLGLAVRNWTPGVDSGLHAFAVGHRGGWVLPVARVVTEGGSGWLLWPLVLVAAVLFPRGHGRRRWLTAPAVGGSAAGLIGIRLLFSEVLMRDRPPHPDWAVTAAGYAFPSGHTTAGTLAAGLLAWAVTRHLAGRRARALLWSAAVVYAGLVGWSRIWLGVHWPLDVLGGWLLGIGWLAATAAGVAWLGGRGDDGPAVTRGTPAR
ncbi:MAG TPA: phosphatase PAP2 family protein [Kineosporiaceae bacterium]|nr:phosphatase PAP2 family protein [Kineosporiaceae bacterium]